MKIQRDERGIRASELTPCSVCSRPLNHAGVPLFLRISFETFGMDQDAARRELGLRQIIPNEMIARALGPDEHVARPLGAPSSGLVCHPCAMEFPVLVIAESIAGIAAKAADPTDGAAA